MMKIEMEKDTLTIYLVGRLDTNTVPIVEKEMPSMEGVNDLVFDFTKVEYISSSGLRFILKYKKQIDHTVVVNCSPEVYDIFTVKGFSEMMEVKKSIRQISIQNAEKIGEGL